MLKKKIFLILLFLITFLAMSAVSAAENVSDDLAIDDNAVFDEALQDGVSNDRIEIVNNENEYNTGNFSFKLVDSNTSLPVEGKKVKLKIKSEVNSIFEQTTDSSGIVYFKTNELKYYVNNNGVISGHMLTAGSYNVTISTDTASVDTTLKVTMADVDITIEDYKKLTGSGEKFTVTAVNSNTRKPASGIVMLIYLPQISSGYYNVTTDADGRVYLDVSKLTAGIYSVDVATNDSNVRYAQKSGVMTILPILKVSASKLSTTYKSGKQFDVRVTDSLLDVGVSGVKVYLKVYTGNGFKKYSLTTNSKGIASFKKDLSVGYHKVIISVDSIYSAKEVTSAINVKPMQLKYTVKLSTAKNTKSFKVFAKDKATNKYINGIKFKVMIYTGSKYQTKYLTSGYDKDSKKNGMIGYATNKLSAGTHKVVIKPASSSYKGSVTTKIVVSKK